MPGTSTEQVVDKGIRQKSIHSFHSIHSFPDGSAFCPGAPKRVPSDSEKHRRVYTSSNVCHSHEWRVDTASGMTLKKQNACLHAVRHAVGKKIACIHGLRSEGVKKETPFKTLPVTTPSPSKSTPWFCLMLLGSLLYMMPRVPNPSNSTGCFLLDKGLCCSQSHGCFAFATVPIASKSNNRVTF